MCVCVCVCVCVLSCFSYVWLCVTQWTVALQAPVSMRILQARIVQWVAMPSSRGSSLPRDGTWISYVSCIRRQVLYPQRHLGSPVTLIKSYKIRAKKHDTKSNSLKNAQHHCVSLLAQSCLTATRQAPSSMEFSRQEY